MERATFEASALLRTRFDVRAALDECITAAGLRAAASDRWLHDARSAHTPPSSQQRRERPGGGEEEPEARARPPAADDGSALAAGPGGGPHRRRAARSPTPRRGRFDA